MSHIVYPTPPRSLRLMAVALAFALVSLLVNAGGPAALNAEAAKDASVSITADKHTSPFRLHRDQVRGGDT